MANLVNFGILPVTFKDKKDYSGFSQGDALDLDVKDFNECLLVKNLTKGTKVDVALSLSELEWSIVKAGGKLAAIKAKQNIKQL
jgi:aconitate hydratase